MKKDMYQKFIGMVLAISFGIAALFGVYLSMPMEADGMMVNCPLMGSIEQTCMMTVTEHLAKWKQLFAAAVPSGITAPVAFLAFAAAAVMLFSFLPQFRLQLQPSRAGPLPLYSSRFLLRALGTGLLRKRE